MGAVPPNPSAGLPSVPGGFVQAWLDHNEARFDRPLPSQTNPLGNAVASFVTGHPTDSYLAGLVERRPVLEQALDRTGMSKVEKAETLKNAVDYEVTRHFNGDMQKVADFKQTLAEFDQHVAQVRKDSAPTSQFIDRLKNTLFGADFGVVGVNTLSGIREGGIPAMMGAHRVGGRYAFPECGDERAGQFSGEGTAHRCRRHGMIHACLLFWGQGVRFDEGVGIV